MRLVFSRNDQRIYAIGDDGTLQKSWECRSEFEPGLNEYGEERESLPLGDYAANADQPPTSANGPAYGTFYIVTGDNRSRDIHGGGSACEDPFAPRQGWHMTYGCLRMQNEDGEELSRMMIDAGNGIPLHVQEEAFSG